MSPTPVLSRPVGSAAAIPLRRSGPTVGRPSLRLVPTGRAVNAVDSRRGVRITRRGRAAITVIVTGAMVACVVLVLHAVAPAPAGPTDVVVEPGQTLSQVAHEALPGLPVGEAVTRVQLANGLNSQQVDAGQHLAIPR